MTLGTEGSVVCMVARAAVCVSGVGVRTSLPLAEMLMVVGRDLTKVSALAMGEGAEREGLGSGITSGPRVRSAGSAEPEECLGSTPLSRDDAGTVTHAVTSNRTASPAPIANRRGIRRR